jgi:hypothetical protein
MPRRRFADDDGRRAGIDLAFAERGESVEIELGIFSNGVGRSAM